MSLSDASITRLANSARLQNAKKAIQRDKILNLAIQIQQIPAPTFHEAERARFVQSEFERLGLENIKMDNLYNVYGWLPHPNPNAPTLLLAAHTDTVFPFETDLSIRREESRVYGVGLGDNSLGVAALLSIAEILTQYDLPRTASICFLANTREEGLGDLGGIKGALDHLDNKIDTGIIIEGMALGRIYHTGIAVRRHKVTVKTQGGHSWLHFGMPSAIHELVHFCERITQIKTANTPRTTYNIGLIEGGSSINTIASTASCHLDLRSQDTATLQQLEETVQRIAKNLSQEQVRFEFELVGNRPAGHIPEDHPLVRLAKDAHQAINMRAEVESGSTDTNALLARGIPAVCVGISYGGNAHTQAEYIETGPLEQGTWQLLLFLIAASNAIESWQ